MIFRINLWFRDSAGSSWDITPFVLSELAFPIQNLATSTMSDSRDAWQAKQDEEREPEEEETDDTVL